MISPFFRDRLRRLPLSLVPTLVVLSLTAWVFVVLNDAFMHHDFAYDESYFNWGGWCINKGLVPYRDFMEFKPPILFLTHALAMKLFGFAAFQYRWFFLLFPLASILALQLAMISRGIDRLCTLALGLAVVQLWVNPYFHDTALSDSESVGLTYYFLGVACLLARTRLGIWLKTPGAAFLVSAVLSKEPFLPSVIGAWATCFLLDARETGVREEAIRYIKVTALGAGLVVVSLCAYLVPTGGMKAYVHMFIGYFRMYRDPLLSYCVVLGRFHPTTPFNDLLVQYRKILDEFLNASVVGYLIPFGLLTVFFVGRRSLLLLAAVLLTTLAAVHAVTASNCMWPHYYIMSMGGLSFALIVGLDVMSSQLRRQLGRWLIGAVLLASALFAVWPRFSAESARFGTRAFKDPYRELVPGLHAAVAQYTTPTDKIFTTGPPLTYVQMDRIGAVRESCIIDECLGYYLGNTDEEKLSGIRTELEQNMPKLVILDPENAHRKVRHHRALLKPFLTAHHYIEVKPYIWLRPY